MVFRDNDHLLQIIERIVAQVGRRIDKSQPLVDARLPDGSRVNAIIPPLALEGAGGLRSASSPPSGSTMDDLIGFKAFTPAMLTLLGRRIKARRNILITGGTGTGKTTLLNILSSFIPLKERIVTIEDTTELQLHQEHVVTLETKPPNIEGAGEYTATRPGEERPAHAARPDHRRRVPRRRGPRHDPGHEHRPRRLDDHRPRQHAARRHEPGWR